MAVKPIPDDYPVVTPYLCVDGAAQAIEFYEKAFGAEQRLRIPAPGGKVGHAELVVGKALIMLADEFPEMQFRSPASLGGSPVTIHMYVEDVDAIYRRAVGAGAKVLQEIGDRFYGDRSATLLDPFGHMWSIASHKEDVSAEELQRRAAAYESGQG